MAEPVVLASASAARAAMLAAAGVPFEVVPANLDEEALTAALLAEGADPLRLADALAEAKAVKVSARMPGRLVLGADTAGRVDGGGWLAKPGTREGLAEQLRALRGRRHRLVSAAVLARDGAALWRHAGVATLAVRTFSDVWLAAHVAAVPEAVLGSVGGYHVEGLGVQLFDAIAGDLWTVRGLPLLAVLAQLRAMGEMPS